MNDKPLKFITLKGGNKIKRSMLVIDFGPTPEGHMMCIESTFVSDMERDRIHRHRHDLEDMEFIGRYEWCTGNLKKFKEKKMRLKDFVVNYEFDIEEKKEHE